MIRSAAVKDASRLAEILIFAKRTAYRPIFQNDYVSFHEMQVLDLALSYRSNPDTLKGIYVYDDGIVKGMMRWGRERHGEAEAAWELKELYIDPFFQNQGIGHKLLFHFLSSAAENRIIRTYLWVLEKNFAARRFYEAHGFLFDGTKRLEPDTPEYLMRYEKKRSSSAVGPLKG